MALPLHLLDVGYDQKDLMSGRSPKSPHKVHDTEFPSNISGVKSVHARHKNKGFMTFENRAASIQGKHSFNIQRESQLVNDSAVF